MEKLRIGFIYFLIWTELSLFDLSQQSWDIGVELSLEEVASNGSTEVVFGDVVTDLDVQATLTSGAGDDLCGGDLLALLEDQEDITVQTAALTGTSANVLGDHLTIGNAAAGNIDDTPVENLTELGVGAAGCIGINQKQSIQGASLGIPANGGLILYLCGCQLVAEFSLHARWIRDRCTALWLLIDDVGNDTAGVHI